MLTKFKDFGISLDAEFITGSSLNSFARDIYSEIAGDIIFNNIGFRYKIDVPIFHNLNLTIAQGSITAIVGESGSGKSTLMSLLQNNYPLLHGKVSIGDLDLSYIDPINLGDVVNIVTQETGLFAGSVIDNITVGERTPDIERIVDICNSIGILEFIENLPNGFNTHLGENGAFLSGGEKQKIAIARALYKDPEILVLDEALSALDGKSENYVQKAIIGLKRRHKTIIIISHRLSSVVYADNIVVLKNGSILEQGDHDTLYAQKSHYHNLWQQQLPILEY